MIRSPQFPFLAQQARHDFDILSSLPTRPRVGVDTFGGVPIDIELPASVSGQHLVNFSVWVGLPVGEREEAGISAELTLPVHLRYPDPGCERRAEECEEYAWVEVTCRTCWYFVPILKSCKIVCVYPHATFA